MLIPERGPIQVQPVDPILAWFVWFFLTKFLLRGGL